jgi:hypothetical protein
VPEATLTHRSKKHRYSITLSGAQQQVGGNFMADGFCGLQIDDQLELGWLFTGRSAGFAPRSQNRTHAPYGPLTRISCELVWE